VMITIEIRLAMSAYSIAVAPRLSEAKFFIRDLAAWE
jgi:hypothetical protein